jgi:hypothetical protein
MKKYVQIILYCFVLVAWTSCSPEYRFNRLLKRYPYLLENQVFDTVVIRDGKITDTIFFFKNDTFRIENIQIIRNYDSSRRDFYYRFNGKSDPCTTRIERTTIRHSEAKKEAKVFMTWYRWMLLGILGTLIVVLITKLK